MATGSGDKLARGAARATFPSLSHVSDKKWADAFGTDTGPKPNIPKPANKTRKRKSA